MRNRAPTDDLTVAEAGETGVLERILAELDSARAATIGPGDDCAVMRVSGQLVITTDMMIEGPDFRRAWHSGVELGWKLAATNLSDVAAMGAAPVGLTVAIACPAETPVALLEDIARGLTAACAELAPECGVVGGDLSRAPVLTVAVTAMGELAGRAPVLRSGAQPGDTLAYAGELGLAGLGLSLLFAESADADGTAHSRGVAEVRRRHPAALGAQLAPRPPIRLGAVAADRGATAMLDVSDGLSIDAARIARASDVRVQLDSAMLLAAFGKQRGEQVPLDALLYGGEDHGLLATFPREVLLPEGFSAIGQVRERDEVAAEAEAEVELDGRPLHTRGWDPFTVRPPGS